MNTPNIDLLLSDITFRRGWLAKMLEVTVHDGDDTRFDAVSIVDLIDELRALRKERDALTMHMNQVHDTLGGTDTVLTLEAAQHVVFERDEAVKRRREIDDEAFDYAEQIETLKTQLAAARELMEEAANDIWYMVNAEYHGPDDVHPAMRAKYARDIEIVTRLTAALAQEGA